MKLSDNLKKYRKQRSLTQKQLSEKSHLSYSMITKLESGEQKNPSLSTLASIVAALDISLSEFLSEREVNMIELSSENFDSIEHPLHYCFSRYEPKDVIRDWGLNFNLGSAVKYIARCDHKGNKLEDLKKAKQFLAFEIEALEKEGSME